MSGAWAGTTWSAAQMPMPVEGKAGRMAAVSCFSSSFCVGVGRYQNAAGKWFPMSARGNGSSWLGQGSPTPTGATQAELSGVSCTTSIGCMATGNYTDSLGILQRAFAVRLSGLSWILQGPISVSGLPGVAAPGVSCVLENLCQTVGWRQSGPGLSAPWATSYTKITKPHVQTYFAQEIGGGSASLQGSVNPGGAATKYYFEYGTSLAYGTKTAETSAGEGVLDITEKETVSGLKSGTLYHYRIVASNSLGTAVGTDQTFTP
jgi:hypothetical protein